MKQQKNISVITYFWTAAASNFIHVKIKSDRQIYIFYFIFLIKLISKFSAVWLEILIPGKGVAPWETYSNIYFCYVLFLCLIKYQPSWRYLRSKPSLLKNSRSILQLIAGGVGIHEGSYFSQEY